MNTPDPTAIPPVPPLRYRFLVGPLDEKAFDNSSGQLVFNRIPSENYSEVFDFGCGCGRVARMLMQQQTAPQKYLGIDINKRMIDWCKRTITPFNSNYQFAHHDVHNLLLGSKNSNRIFDTFPAPDNSFTLFIAISVFTHVLPEQTEFYLSEASRILKPGGLAMTSWFLFNKRDFPMMQAAQNALYINANDPTNAVIYDEEYVRDIASDRQLEIVDLRGNYQRELILKKQTQRPANLKQEKYREIPVAAVQAPPSKLPIRLNQILGVIRQPSKLFDRKKLAKIVDLFKSDSTASSQLPLPLATSTQDLYLKLTTDDHSLVDSPTLSQELLPCVFKVENIGATRCLTINSEQNSAPILRFRVKWENRESCDSSFYENLLPIDDLKPKQHVLVPIIVEAPKTPGKYCLSISLIFGTEEMPNATLKQDIQVLHEV